MRRSQCSHAHLNNFEYRALRRTELLNYYYYDYYYNYYNVLGPRIHETKKKLELDAKKESEKKQRLDDEKADKAKYDLLDDDEKEMDPQKQAVKEADHEKRFGMFKRCSEEWVSLGTDLRSDAFKTEGLYDSCNAKYEAVKTRLEETGAACTLHKKEIESINIETKELNTKINDLTEATAATGRSVAEINKSLKGKSKEIKDEKKATLDSLNEKLRDDRAALSAARNQLVTLDSKLLGAKEKLRNLDSDSLELEATLAVWSMKLTESRELALRAMNRQVHRRLVEIIYRVANIITSSTGSLTPKYSK